MLLYLNDFSWDIVPWHILVKEMAMVSPWAGSSWRWGVLMGLHLVIHVCMSIVTRMYEYCAGWDGILLRHNQIIPNYYLYVF